MSILNRAYFRDEAAAHAFLEGLLWPGGPVCPHCGGLEKAYKIAANPERRVRHGLWKCGHCRKQFTVKIGTVFEHARIPLHKALQAVYLLSASKKGISSNQLSRALEISLKAAWFLSHRVREAMRDLNPAQLGSLAPVESDETYVGGLERNRHRVKRNPLKVRGGLAKEPVFSLVERGGKVRSHHVADVTAKTLRSVMVERLKEGSTLYTDSSPHEKLAGKAFKHEAVNHKRGECVRGEVHTNTIESVFAVLKRGVYGTYHAVSKQHLHRYLAEFDFRYNNRAALAVDDFTRTTNALLGIRGKRLTYKPTSHA